MRINSLDISNLRNLASIRIEPDSCLNCFIGDNGAGKTSILEALAVLSKGRSFRAGQISSLIGPKHPHFQVISKIESQTGKQHRLGMERSTDQWSARHNGENIAQLSDLTELLPYVLLEPGSHILISGPPDGRRKYLDWGVFHVEHGFLTLWRRYSRTLKQRNAALRQSEPEVVKSLDPQLITLGEKLHQAREQHTDKLEGALRKIFPLFDPILESTGLSYRKGWAGESLKEALDQSFQRDMETGATGSGPHRADLVLTLDGAPAKERLSRGEQKAMTAAMILAQAQMICVSGERPVMLLDDLSSELDETHLTRVLQVGLGLGVQIWLTGTKLSPAIKASGITNGFDYAMFHVEHGKVSRINA